MQIIRDPGELTAWSEARRGEGKRVGLVPTMGFLHAGHLSLMERLRPQVDCLIVSIYVNPLQFGPSEDLDCYPRDEDGDLAKCNSMGADVVFTPEDLYPDGFSTSVSVHGLTNGLCGGSRPGHFEGVATVVTRLFGLSRCHTAIFGEKDYQQLCVIRRMVGDLALGVEVVGAPIARADDGLALSSRNAYLTAPQREQGLTLSRALYAIQAAFAAGEADVNALLQAGHRVLNVDSLDYLEIVDAASLEPLERVTERARVLVAASVGRTRLIDNMTLEPAEWTPQPHS